VRGYSPMAPHMGADPARGNYFVLLVAGIGGTCNWRYAAEFLALGSSSVQVCTEVMLRGYRIVEDMIEGLSTFMSDRGMTKLDDLIGKAVPTYSEWGDLDMNYETVAKIDADKCIGCHLCVVACDDGAHQCIHAEAGTHVPRVDESECVGCNLCQIVCPVPDCITMDQVDNGYAPTTWNEHTAGLGKLRPKKGVHY